MHFKRLAHNLNRSWIYLNKSSYHTQDLTNYRTLINVKGADSAKYLQNLITNDINLLQNESIISIYSHILNNRGRTLYDTIVYKNKFDQSGEPSYLIEIDSQFINEAIKLLSLFKIKKKVDIKVMDDKFKLYSVFNDESNKILQINEIEKDLKCKEYLLAQDPRTSFLGFRLIVNNETKDIQSEHTDLKRYKKFLYKNGIAENNQDIINANSIPLEYNLVFLNGVSFSKGCYLGQELVAKTHHTGVIRKRIMPLKLTAKYDKYPVFKSGADIINEKTGKSVGKLRNIIEDEGIGLIRLSNIDNSHMVVLDENETKHKCQVNVPKYWLIDDALQKELNASKF